MRHRTNTNGQTANDALPRDDSACQRILQAADYYQILGVARGSDDAAIKKEFRLRAREVHPDKNSSSLAEEAFKRLQKAYEVLSDSSARTRYDYYGEEKAQPTYQHQPRYYAHRHHYRYADDEPDIHIGVLLRAMLLPLLLGTMVTIGVPLMFDPTRNFEHSKKTAEQKPTPEAFTHLTKFNADATCGSISKKMCVVLLTKPKGISKTEADLLKTLRNDAKEIKNSRGQALPFAWATAPAVGRWSSLLPATASLPWVVVLKPSKVGLRVAAMPVPREGAKKKGRLSAGVPRLLQAIAAGEAKFDSASGTVSSLFAR
eukprot:TRINITY_DN37951_c0_g1_i1.p1 TRINITY_DN37951_c0_g1~~TRINITY_DN37951_c0_g1_i1.p1  ORF type:complete len:342 (-),score=50.92 TRINITY_DN37951_c0_g1_i1:76-1023(-)